MRLLIAGWKSVSFVDVYGYVAFTIWTCGCNLHCPFCHNWRLADKDPSLCREMDIHRIVSEIEASRFLVDYVHVTGGEPLLQYVGVGELFTRVGNIGVKRSLNSNLTLPQGLRPLLEKRLVDHIATDLKIPPEEVYGLRKDMSELYWNRFVESLKLIKQYDVELELRIPVWRGVTEDLLSRYLDEIESVLNKDKTLILLNPLLGYPYVEPRDKNWCSVNLGVNDEKMRSLVELLSTRGFAKIVVKSIPGFKVASI